MEKKIGVGRPKLSNEKKSYVMQAYMNGMPVKQILDVFGISQGSLYSIINEYKQKTGEQVCRMKMM